MTKPCIAQIIPIKKMPRNMNFLDYLVPENMRSILRAGHLVQAPFKNKKIAGIVVKIKNSSSFDNLKELLQIKQTVPCISRAQLKLAFWFSKYYNYSLASTVRLMLTDLPARRTAVREPTCLVGSRAVSPRPAVSKLAEKLLSQPQQKTFLIDNDPQAKFELLAGLCTKIVQANKQILIIVPHKQQLQICLDHLPADLKPFVFAATADKIKSKSQAYLARENIKAGNKKIIIGTRSAVFYDIPELEMIFIDYAHHEDLKSRDQTPRYNAIDAAKQIQSIRQCRLALCSCAPRTADFYHAKQADFQLLSLGQKTADRAVKIIDLIKARGPEFTYISNELIKAITDQLENRQKVLVIVNKKGYAGYLLCSNCDYIPTCARCLFPYTVVNDHLRCFHCHEAQPIPAACPKCSKNKFISLGIGIDQIIEFLTKEFARAVITNQLTDPADIYVSTAQLSRPEIFTQVNLLAIAYVDSLMYFPDFSTNERIYQMLLSLINQYQQYRTGDLHILLQTCFPNNQALANINKPYLNFYRLEIASRRQFNYPPFVQLIKIFFDHHDQKICAKQAQTLYNELSIKYGKQLLMISEPFFYYRQQIRSRFRCQILIKYDQAQADPLYELLSLLPNYWRIDKDPLSVI